MEQPRFIIFVETLTGEFLRVFTWSRDRASGVDRARQEVSQYGEAIKIRSEAL